MNISTHKKSEVDLKVAQELKNHRDFVYQTNTALQGINSAIISLSLEIEKIKSKIGQDLKKVEIDFSNHKDKIADFQKQCNQKIDSQNSVVDKQTKESSKNTSAVKTLKQGLNEIENNLVHWIFESRAMFDKIRELENSHASSSNLMKGYINTQISGLRNELTPEPVTTDPIKEALDERLTPIQIDFAGVMKEIALIKKAMTYSDRKFENIYTLIERLKDVQK